ncbi:MAG: COG1470 family protein [Planctomycetota bacterium]|jgi:hypothetical protein
MKISNVLTICFVLCCLFTSNVFGNGVGCTVQLDDSIFPNNGVYQLGDTIEYEITLAIPPSNGDEYCELENFEAFFLNPTVFSGVDACADPAISILSSDPLAPGDSYMFDSSIIPELSYEIKLEDCVEVPGLEGKFIVAKLCSSWIPDSDTKTVYNRVLAEPCIQVTKEACPYSKVGDTVIYTITIENCGDVDLQILSLEDSLLPLDPFICSPVLPVGATCQIDVPYIVQPGDLDPLINEVTVEAVSTFDGTPVSATAQAEVDLLQPELVVDIQCVTNDIPVPGGPETTGPVPNGFATFEVCVRNTGDVALDIRQSDCFQFGPLPLPPRLEPEQEECMEVVVPVDGGFCGGGGEAWLECCVTATIPPEYCELPNVIVACGDAVCEVPPVNPCFDVTKTCVNDPVCGGDPALYNITITNCGDVPLFFMIQDDAAGPVDSSADVSNGGGLPPGASETVQVAIPTYCPSDIVTNTVTVEGYCLDGTPVGLRTATAACEVACPDLEVQKICLDEPVACNDELADFEVVITNTGNVPLDLTIEDPDAIAPVPGGPILPGESISRIVQVPSECGSGSVGNLVTVIGVYDDCAEVVRTAAADCPVEPCCDPEGCTPGFWKNHPDCWCDYYTPEMLLSDVFVVLNNEPYVSIDDDDRKSDFNNDTLADALRYRGGRGLAGTVRNMLRHATAALLNACSSDVGYPISVEQVIGLVNLGLDSQDIAVIQDVHTLFAAWNEETPCPIDAHCRVIDDEVNGY